MKKINFLERLFFIAPVGFVISLSLYSLIIKNYAFKLFYDMYAYYIGGAAVLNGTDIYAKYFIYTPFSALLFALLALFPFETTRVFVTLLSFGAFVFSIWVALSLLGFRSKSRITATLLSATVLMWLEPVQQTLNFGQINLLLLALIMAGFYKLDDKWLKGIGIGLATSIKLTPLIFIAYLFFTRRFQAGMIAVGACIVSLIAGFIFLPEASAFFWGGYFVETGRIGDVVLTGHQSLNGMLSRVFGDEIAAKPYWYLSVLLVGFTGFFASITAARKGNELLGLILCGLTGLLISPFSWSHHWVWIAIMMLYIIHIAFTQRLFVLCIVIAVLLVLFGWFTPVIPNLSSFPHLVPYTPATWHGLSFIQQNVYVLTGLLFIAVSAYYLRVNKKPAKRK